MRVFGIDPGSERTGYGCVETDGRRHRLVLCGAISTAGASCFAARLGLIHHGLAELLRECAPNVVAIENLFHAVNVRSALKLGHARGVAMLAAVEAGLDVVEYTPTEIKRAVVGYGRADKPQVQQMVKLLLGLAAAPSPHDAADALAVALCHVHRIPDAAATTGRARSALTVTAKSWRSYRPAAPAVRRVRASRASPMIAWLKGRLIEKHPTRLILDVHGVGYDVHVPVSTFYAVGEPGAEVTLRVHTHVREDALALFGFLTAFELQVFERLIATSGIGPKLALAVLSGIEAGDFVSAVQRSDVGRLTRIPGVGKKTAERICLELKDKLPLLAEAGMPTASAPAPNALRDDLVSALVNLGYHRSAVDKVLDKQLAGDDEPRFEAALRAALKELARS